MITQMMDPLNDTNWNVWKGCMKCMFKLCKVLAYIFGDVERPDPTLDPISAENQGFNDSYAAILIYENILSSQKVYMG